MIPVAHSVRVLVEDRQVEGWISYSIDSDMLEPADSFSMVRPFDREAWDLLRVDRRVRVLVDDVTVLDGAIDQREKGSQSGTLQIEGRDWGGRLVDESAPVRRFGDRSLAEIAADLVAPWFDRVVFSNARNRAAARGRGRKARAGREPGQLSARRRQELAIEPGDTRWAVLERLLAEYDLLAWSSADGKELIIGRPNYEQEVQYRFFQAAEGSERTAETNVLDLSVLESVAARYSRITVVGAGAGNATNYGENVARRGVAKDNITTAGGEGRDFVRPKRLLIADDDVRSAADAQAAAGREMALRDAGGLRVTAIAPHHGQVVAGAHRTLYATDTMADVEDEETGTRGAMLVTKRTFGTNRERGEFTTLELVPKGTELSL